MDSIDQALLVALSENLSSPTTLLAKKLGLARSTVQSRIERLESNGVIDGYTIKLGPGFDPGRIRATVLVKVEPKSSLQVVQKLREIAQVEKANTTSGQYDLVLIVAAPTPSELDGVLDKIGVVEGVTDMESLIHLSTKFDRMARVG